MKWIFIFNFLFILTLVSISISIKSEQKRTIKKCFWCYFTKPPTHMFFYNTNIFSIYKYTFYIYLEHQLHLFDMLLCTHTLVILYPVEEQHVFRTHKYFFPFYHHFCCSCFFFSWHKINHFCEYNTHNFCSVVVVGSFLFVKFRTAKVQKIAPTRKFVICFCISTITFLYKKKHTISKQRTFFGNIAPRTPFSIALFPNIYI